MTPVQALGMAVTVLGSIPSAYYVIKARHRLSPKGETHPWTVYWLGVMAASDDFTVEGWKFHRRFRLAVIITGLIALPLLIFG